MPFRTALPDGNTGLFRGIATRGLPYAGPHGCLHPDRCMTALVEAIGITKHFPVRGRGVPLRAVDGVDLAIQPGETLGLVGESGCGKSTLGRLLIRLIPATMGRVLLDGTNIMVLDAAALRPARRAMQIIFQDPYGALNPRMSVADIIAEPLAIQGTAAVSRQTQMRQ